MRRPLVTILGKAVKHAASIRGGGSALPGLVVEKIDPNFMSHCLSSLPMGVVVVSGTNGKTTTTKMVVELLEGQGLKVFTNKTGSNFTRGVVAALLSEVNIKGDLDADIAVLELDEAHAVHFVDKIQPNYCLLLNVMRDQLDRFGEIDHTANLLRHIAEKTREGVVLNLEDPRIANIAKSISPKKIKFFGLDQSLLKYFPSDDDLHARTILKNDAQKTEVTLLSFSKNEASFLMDGQKYKTKLKLSGIYNIFNAAAAMALVKAIFKDDVNNKDLMQTLSKIEPAFGRGEKILVNGTELELVLVKNPSGFRLGLESFNPGGHKTMIAINDNYADGRDMSWLWDVDFSTLSKTGVKQISGIRAYDMALRLKYDEITFSGVDTNLKRALKKFLECAPKTPKRIFCTYTAMLEIRKNLSKIAKVKKI